MTFSTPRPSVFPGRRQVTAARERAAERARVIAEQTGIQLIVSTPPAKPATTPDGKSL